MNALIMFSCCWEIIFPVWGWIAVLNENKASAVYSANMKLVLTELGKNNGKFNYYFQDGCRLPLDYASYLKVSG